MQDEPLYPQHTVEVPPNASRLNIVVQSVIIVMLLISGDMIVRQATDNTLHSRKYMWGVLNEQTIPVDTLIVGDSTGWIGLDPALAEEILGGPALNLSTNALWSTADDVWMTEAYIDRFGPPERLIVFHAPWAYGETIDYEWFGWMHTTAYTYSDDFRQQFFTAEQRREIAIRQALPLIYRQEEKAELLERAQTNPEKLAISPTTRYQQELERISLRQRTAQDALEAGDLFYGFYYEGKTFALSDHAAYNLQRLEEISTKYDIPLYIVTSPHLKEIVDRYPTLAAYITDYDAYFTARAATNPLMHFLPTRYYPPDIMNDLYHVDGTGRPFLSREIFNEIRAIEQP